MDLELSPEVEELIKAMLGELNEIKGQMVSLNAQIDTIKGHVLHQIPNSITEGFEKHERAFEGFQIKFNELIGAILHKLRGK